MTWEMGDKVVNTHSSTIQFVPEYYKTQKMCDKSSLPVFFFFISDDPFSMRYVPDQ